MTSGDDVILAHQDGRDFTADVSDVESDDGYVIELFECDNVDVDNGIVTFETDHDDGDHFADPGDVDNTVGSESGQRGGPRRRSSRGSPRAGGGRV